MSGSRPVNLRTELYQPAIIYKRGKSSFLRRNRGNVLIKTAICKTGVVTYVSSRISNT